MEPTHFAINGRSIPIRPHYKMPCEIASEQGDYVLTEQDAAEYRAVNRLRLLPVIEMRDEAEQRLSDQTLSKEWKEHYRYTLRVCKDKTNRLETLCKSKAGDILNTSRVWVHTLNGRII
jgi:hypothetical protein